MFKAIKTLATVVRWLVFILAAPFIGVFVLRSFLGVLLVLAGHGGVEDWLAVFSSLAILAVAVVVLSYRVVRLASKQ